ncbi:MAG: hypothetical protein JRF02_04915 [Deltaproteobacteria bacterium]|jgi:hypothetical protein|nr:hypothetical protein [Deltaproteobacteria bacterium]
MLRVLQFLISSTGIAIIVWAYLDPQFRNAEGFLEGGFCLPFSAGVAFILSGWGLPGTLRRSAFWLALALTGQAVTLQLIEAGPRGEYQHYIRPFIRLLTETHPVHIIYLAIQSVLVFAGIRAFWPAIVKTMNRSFKVWQIVAVFLLFFISTAPISFFPDKTIGYEIPVYLGELIFATYIQILNLLNIILVVWSIPEDVGSSIQRRFQKLGILSKEHDNSKLQTPIRLDNFAFVAAIWVTVFAALLSILSYQRVPHIPDETAYLYQARYFAEGMLTMPAPRVPEAFNIELMDINNEKWYSAQLPGWPAILSLGVLLGVPWLVNPILAGINILLAYLFLQGIYNRYTARIALILLCVSPWYVFMAMNFMTHTLTLTYTLAAANLVIAARKTGNAAWGWISGFFIGMLSLIRPLEALVIAGLIGLWSIGIGGSRLKFSALCGIVLGTILVGMIGLYYNFLMTGDPLSFPFTAYTDKYYWAGSNNLGFGASRDMGWRTLDPLPGHGFIDVLINAGFNIFSMNTELFGWSTGSLLFIAIILFSGGMRKNDYLMFTVIACIIGIHTFYWFGGGPDFGARYWYLVILPCVVLTVRGMQYLAEKFRTDRIPDSFVYFKCTFFVMVLCFLTLVNYFPWRAIDKYFHYRGQRPDIRYLEREYNFGKSLVLINGKRHIDYASAAVFNPVSFNDDSPIYAWNKSPEIRNKLLENYSDRDVWFVNGPSITRKGFEVIGGPINASQLALKQLK